MEGGAKNHLEILARVGLVQERVDAEVGEGDRLRTRRQTTHDHDARRPPLLARLASHRKAGVVSELNIEEEEIEARS